MEKKIVTFITIVLVLVIVPYVIYTVYIRHQDDMYKTLKEFTSYTTLDKEYDIKVMKYQGVSGEEVYNFKFYITKKSTGETKFIKNLKISSYGTDIKFTEDKKSTSYTVDVVAKSSSGSETFSIDMDKMMVKGQHIRAVI